MHKQLANLENLSYTVNSMQNTDPRNDLDRTADDPADRLRLAFVAERARQYNLHIPARLELIDQLAEMVDAARKSYRENLSKA